MSNSRDHRASKFYKMNTETEKKQRREEDKTSVLLLLGNIDNAYEYWIGVIER